MAETVRGRFVWHELMTPNGAGAQAFYSKALGWKTQPWEQDPNYSIFAARSGPVGGSSESRDGPTRWLPFIGTPDIDATVRQSIDLGGRVTTQPTPLPNGGKYAVLADPQGAAFGTYWSSTAAETGSAPNVGEFSWHELATADNGAAFDFYAEVFGWQKLSEFDMGPMGIYLIFGRDGTQWGGMFNRADAAPHWLGYVRVKDVHDAVGKVQAARGSLANGPMEVPGGDWIAQFMDPYGAFFAVHALAADVKPARSAEPPSGARKKAAKKTARKADAKKKSKKAAKKASKKASKKTTKKTAKKSSGAKKKAKSGAKPARRKTTGKKRQKKAAKKKVAKRKGAKKKARRARRGARRR